MEEGKDYPINTESETNKLEIVQEVPYPTFWSRDLAEKWGSIPEQNEFRNKTPLIELNLIPEGFGKVFIKDESDQSINPTGTMKDRMAQACAAVYRERAKFYLEVLAQNPGFEKNLKTTHIPRFSLITAGNAGRALANAFETHGLPPPKLLLDVHTPHKAIEKLKSMRADLYLTDLSKNTFNGKPATESPLLPEQILELTHNEGGHDLTSANEEDNPERPWRMFYYGLGGEILPLKPAEIYAPYGSGATFEGLVDRQFLFSFDDEEIGKIKIFGAEPESFPSIADKLAAPAKPYVFYNEARLNLLKQDFQTHPETGVYKVLEEEIKKAYEILKRLGEPAKIRTEPSAAAGLALYIKRWGAGKIDKNDKIIIINTGRGAFAE